jgi:hypothetical protein
MTGVEGEIATNRANGPVAESDRTSAALDGLVART